MSKEGIVVTFMNGPADGRWSIINSSSITIGRGSDNDIVIDFDPTVAEKHLELQYHNDQWRMVNHSEGRKVLMDGKPVDKLTPLEADKLITIGATLFKFEITGQ